PTLHMVIEALQAQDERKGTSVIAIKRFILAKYPAVDPVRLKYLLKQALSKGLSRGDLVLPHNASAVARAPGKGRSGPPVAPAAEDAGGGDGDSPAGAEAKGPRKAPVGKSKGKAPKGAQQDASKAKGGQGKARKPRAAQGAGQGEARLRKAAPTPAGRKAP
ncbi:PREDICTED: protein B4, partial [Fulmarus glacialis]|uniref:protein B4 n=1 Tax=Fulmarus glacialis TaxID=30455 RepID=UPI00051B9F62